MLAMRFKRIGKKNRPSFRVVVAEHSFATDGRFLADVGFYDPHTKKAALKTDEIKRWLDKGARPSNSVAKLLQREKIKHKLVVVIQRLRAPKIKQEAEAKTNLSVSNNVAAPADGTVELDNSDAVEGKPSSSKSPTPDNEVENSSPEVAQPVTDAKN